MMRRLRLLVASTFLVGTIGFVGAGSVGAFELFPCSENSEATVCQEARKNQSQGNNSLFGPNGVLAKVVNILSLIVGIAAVIMIMVAGIQYMLSSGDPAKVSSAKNIIIYSSIGLVIAATARIIVVYVIGRLG